MTSSQGFRRLPSDITKIWTLREMSLIAEPSSSAAADVAYESPLKEISLTVRFMSTDEIDSLPYVVDGDSFIPEWNFANEAWENLTEGVTQLVTAYNKALIKRAREKKLTSVTVIGRSRTEHDRIKASEAQATVEVEPPVASPLKDRQVETVYEPTIRSTRTARSKITPIQAWMSGIPYKSRVR
jgi:hypothetical protein